MSREQPVFGIDVHPEFQWELNLRQAAQEVDFCMIKASEGPYPSGRVLPLPEFVPFVDRAEVAGFDVLGLYCFLLDTSPQKQAEHFLRRVESVGGPRGKLLMIDFEWHPDATLTPYNEDLKEFVRALRREIGAHPLLLYSNTNFWNNPPPAGPVSDYGNLTTWEARYPLGFFRGEPRDLYNRSLPFGWGRFGSQDPMFWQFTSSGRVANQYVDVNAFRGTGADLRSLTIAATPLVPLDPPDEPDTPQERLMANVSRAASIGSRFVELGIKYWCWDGQSLNLARPIAGRPASVDGPLPLLSSIRRGFCADLISWQLRHLGKPIPKNRYFSENYDGGTRAFKLRYGKQMIPFDARKVRRGDCPFVDFQTPWSPEGHIGFSLGDGPNARILQSHLETSCSIAEPGFNSTYTVEQSHNGGYYTHIIPREAIWG